MTTKNSPLRVLKSQADRIAQAVKAAERGEQIDIQFAEKIRAARARESFKIGIVMDDKLISINITWTKIRETSEVSLAEYILKHMRESRDAVH